MNTKTCSTTFYSILGRLTWWSAKKVSKRRVKKTAAERKTVIVVTSILSMLTLAGVMTYLSQRPSGALEEETN